MPVIALAEPDAAERARSAWKGEVLGGEAGHPRADRAHGAGPRAQRDRRLGRPRPDDRDAQRRHRPGAREQGEPRRRRRAGHRARRGGRRADHPGRLRALGPAPADRGRAARDGRAARADRLRRALPRPHRPQRHHPRAGARAPDLGDGRQDHDRLGDADEQGPRADRGPPPVRRSLRADRRRRPPAVADPLAGPPDRRRHARPHGLPGHARADLLRAALPRPRRRPARAPRPRRGRRAHVRARPTPRPSAACALAREAGEAGGTAPCILNAANEVAVAAFLAGELPFSGIAEVVAGALEQIDAIRPEPLRGPVRRRRRGARSGGGDRRAARRFDQRCRRQRGGSGL